jgi:hypothetical protein
MNISLVIWMFSANHLALPKTERVIATIRAHHCSSAATVSSGNFCSFPHPEASFFYKGIPLAAAGNIRRQHLLGVERHAALNQRALAIVQRVERRAAL